MSQFLCIRCLQWYQDSHVCQSVAMPADVPTVVRFTISGEPLPKQRPRFNGNRAYTPQTTKDYEIHVGYAAKRAMVSNSLILGDCSLSATFYRKDKRRADLDNLLKAIKDACNGIVWQDDKQVVEYGKVRVVYGVGEDNARAEVMVTELEEKYSYGAA